MWEISQRQMHSSKEEQQLCYFDLSSSGVYTFYNWRTFDFYEATWPNTVDGPDRKLSSYNGTLHFPLSRPIADVPGEMMLQTPSPPS